MDLQGPENFASAAALAILDQSQTPMILAALALHKSTIFSRPEWKRLPWTLHPERRSPIHDLLDILADCTELHALKDKADVKVLSDHGYALYREILDSLTALSEQLKQWQIIWFSLHKDSPSETTCSRPPPRQLDSDGRFVHFWESSLNFESLHDAQGHGLFYAILILLRKLQLVTLTAAGLSTVQDIVFEQEMFHAGIAICRSVDYHVNNSHAGTGSLILLFPLRMAYEAVVGRSPPIAQWLREILRDINLGSAGRWASAKHLLDVGFQNRLLPQQTFSPGSSR